MEDRILFYIGDMKVGFKKNVSYHLSKHVIEGAMVKAYTGVEIDYIFNENDWITLSEFRDRKLIELGI